MLTDASKTTATEEIIGTEAGRLVPKIRQATILFVTPGAKLAAVGE